MKPSSSSGGSRANALWGRGGRQGSRNRIAVAVLAATAALAVPAAGIAGTGNPAFGKGATSSLTTLSPLSSAAMPHFGGATGPAMTASLINQVQSHPNQVFKFIVMGSKGSTSSGLAQVINGYGHATKQFSLMPGVTATITGAQLKQLAHAYPKLHQSITVDRKIKTADFQDGSMWPGSADVSSLLYTTDPNTGEILGPGPQTPAVALIDSGVNSADAADFGSRVIDTEDFCSLCTDKGTGADTEGHGTMVAGVLAGGNPDLPGAAPNAPIVSLRVADANGESMESDVIAACGWIANHASKYGIKVVNISMAGATPTSFRFDPLDQAVEQLWFQGIVVVAAAGNFGNGTQVDMSAAPGNDPFIITVGALDQNQTSDPLDDTVAPWSAYGYTADGFSKPDISAPGRYMVMPVPMGSTIPDTVPDRVLAPGYMWMSGTSFAAPIVAGAAAQILARHPNWTPDQVKGALMLTSTYLPNVDWQSAGVGEVDAGSAANLPFDPPNPNENLDTFVTVHGNSGNATFDQAAWASAVSSDAAWSSAAWSSAAWSSAAWASAAWASAAWSSKTFNAKSNTAMESLGTYTEATYTP